MTATHCATCNCPSDERPPPPSTSSPGIRALALNACKTAVDTSRRNRSTVNKTEETP